MRRRIKFWLIFTILIIGMFTMSITASASEIISEQEKQLIITPTEFFLLFIFFLLIIFSALYSAHDYRKQQKRIQELEREVKILQDMNHMLTKQMFKELEIQSKQKHFRIGKKLYKFNIYYILIQTLEKVLLLKFFQYHFKRIIRKGLMNYWYSPSTVGIF